ncbi:MAG: outer membrane protein transport protein [Tepidimonas ignava]|uniref:OmpP1/FadL family transporter n=1 Tax=Tepidimonas ignava TaxID=114249 RepID=UPI002A2AD520|nr:outer membrane protein transport protein [Tepidimonas ignava]
MTTCNRWPVRHTIALAALLVAAPWAHATNGYFPHGFGLKAKGMGGASIAMAQDGFAGVNNPAAAAFVGNRWDVGAEIFRPYRDAQFVGQTPVVESGKTAFLIPEFGYNVKLSERLALGLTVYGNGGMNTSYAPFPNGVNLLGGQGKLGVDLMQLIVAPTLAYQVAEGHALGISPLLVLQRFEAYGIQGFAMMSQSPGDVSNRGKDSSTGVGVRLGYFGKLGDRVNVGVAYSPKVSMSKFDKYKGLFAGGGDFDIPENFGVGVAVQVTPAVTVALDATRINYGGVPSIANGSLSQVMAGKPLGAADGPGFGWRDVNVVKLGVQWQLNPQWTLRAGYNQGDNPIRAQDAMFNILAPGVIRKHITFGATYAPDKASEWTFALWHGKRENVVGPSVDFMSGAMNPTGTRIGMHQNGFGLQYSRKF